MLAAPQPLPPVKRFALLIGVNEYKGQSDLLGPRNDIIAWLQFLRRMEVPLSNIWIRTSPRLTAQELGLDASDTLNLGDADTAGVEDAVENFRTQVMATENAVALFVFCGHGDGALPVNSVYLSDYDGENGLLNMRDVEWKFNDKNRDKSTLPSVTCIWDTCRRQDADTGGMVVLRPWNCVELYATTIGQESFERCFGGTWRGQFSWALLTVLDQWPVTRDAQGTKYVCIHHQTLMKSAATLVSTFNGSRSQFPELHDVKFPSAFLMPMGTTVLTSEYAADGVPHEFPTGTTDFTDTTVSPNVVFAKFVRTSTAITYWVKPAYWLSTYINWPTTFTAVCTDSTTTPGSPFVPHPITATTVNSNLTDNSATIGGNGTMYYSNGGWIRMQNFEAVPNGTNTTIHGVNWAHRVASIDDQIFGHKQEDAMLQTSGDHTTASMSTTRPTTIAGGDQVANPVWRVWTDKF